MAPTADPADPAPAAAPGPLSLRVAEARAKDVGRGLVRVDPDDLARLDAAIGDVVEITGQTTTVARLMPAFAAERGQALVQMDGILRGNADTGLGETVTLRRVEAPVARTVTLQGPGAVRRGQGRHLARLLDGLPVCPGDQVRVDLIGTRAETFRVTQTAPSGAVRIGPTTTVRVEKPAQKGRKTPSAPPPEAITYEDIGGLGSALQRIREMIELPLRYPEVFDHLGIDAPKGVLLYGPPGTGKTLIARAVAHETNAHFIVVNGPEVIDKMYGASEAQLRKLFEEASRKAPSILFIDELDAIAPKRDDLSGDRQVERRVVAQLLALMDGLQSRGHVIVVAATNLPDSLDPALRRPGRFDREISIGVPDREGRAHILEIHSRGMPLADDIDLDHLAGRTHGYVGADLEALCREAAMRALRRLLPDLDLASASIPYDQLAQLTVTAADFETALAEIEPSAIREIFTEIPNVTWADVGGLDAVKEVLQETVQWPLQHPDLFERVGTTPPRGILLHGPPGTGKTLLAKAAARESEVNFISVKGPELLSQWVGASEKGVREVFRKARQAAPCLIFLDEADALIPRRTGQHNPVTERVVNQFLAEMDGIEALNGVLVLAATNRPDLIDPALLRPGRFELQIGLEAPDAVGRRAILEVHTRRQPLAADVDLEALATRTEGLTGAELAGLCREAAMRALRAHVHREASADEPLAVSGMDFDAALDTLRASSTPSSS